MAQPAATDAIPIVVLRGARNHVPIAQDELTWSDLCDEIEALATQEVAASKLDLLAIVPARLRQPYVVARNVEAVTVLAIDLDRVNDENLERLESLGIDAILYETPSSEAGALRVRVFARVSREIASDECRHTRLAFAELLGAKPGCGVEDCLDPPRLNFVGRLEGTPERTVVRFHGTALDVDALLATNLSEPWRSRRRASSNDSGAPIPLEVPADERAARLVGALLPFWAPAGENMGRRRVGRALGGYLARRGWSDEQIAAVARALPSDKPAARVREMIDCARQARAGDAGAAGWNALHEWDESAAAEIEDVARDPREPEGFVGIWSEWWARAFRPGGWARRAPSAFTGDNVGHVPEETGASETRADCDPEVDHVIAQLAAPTVRVYQRSGALVTITRDAHDDGELIRPRGAPVIRELALPRLKEIIRMTCGSRLSPMAAEVLARGEWAHVRPLDAIVTYPVMRRDGTLLLMNGYDAATRTIAEMSVHVAVQDAPTQDDARTAIARMLDVVGDFPFACDEARAAWLAMVLTIVARPAIDGPTPLVLLDANQRGAGKTLLADVASVITRGDVAPRRVAPKTREEWDKTLFSILLAGDSFMLIDNVTAYLASDALDAILTGTVYQQRLLGVSEERRVAIRTVFAASANNARLSTDLVRRALHCRLESDREDPAQRTGYRYPDLMTHVRRERGTLLAAALTIVRAYAVAGRPAVVVRPMGSYEAWARVVRDAIVWAGGADPVTTQDELRETADVERDELRDLLTAWHALLSEKPCTVKEVLDAARTGRAPGIERAKVPSKFAGDRETPLLDALRGIMPGENEPSAHGIGNRLRVLRGQIINGLVLREERATRGKVRRWRVVVVRAGTAGTCGDF